MLNCFRKRILYKLDQTTIPVPAYHCSDHANSYWLNSTSSPTSSCVGSGRASSIKTVKFLLLFWLPVKGQEQKDWGLIPPLTIQGKKKNHHVGYHTPVLPLRKSDILKRILLWFILMLERSFWMKNKKGSDHRQWCYRLPFIISSLSLSGPNSKGITSWFHSGNI